MHKKLIPAAIAATTLLLPLAGHAQGMQTYAGNGATGFGGTLGGGSVTVSDSATNGTVTFQFNPNGGFSGNDVVVYIDSQAGGFSDTSTFRDNADGGREAISGYSGNTPNPQTVVNFASGFTADYAISFENNTFNGLFSLASGGSGGSFTYISGVTPPNGGPYTLVVPDASIGVTPGSSVKFVATLIANSGYRSNETVGASTSTTDPGNAGSAPNPGYGGTTTFSSFNTYKTTALAAAPELSSVASLLIGAGVLGGAILVRRRRQTA